MLSRAELKALQAHRDYPSVSVLLPTHRTAPANKQDRTKARNLVKKAVDRLHKEFGKRAAAAVVANLNKLVAGVDWEHTLDGLALFAARDFARAVELPFKVRARAFVDETFATRDLVFTLNRAPAYRVLVLGLKPVRLFDAWTDVLHEVTAAPFPLTYTGPGPGAGSPLPGGKGINPSAVRDDAHRQFFRQVDEALGVLQKAHRRPLVVTGVDRYLAFFREVTRHGEDVVGMLAGSHDATPPTALGKLVWPIFQAGATVARTQALTRLGQAVGKNRHASGIDQVWRAAREGLCQVLLVEEDFEYPADVAPDGERLLPYTGKGAAALDDAVDEVIERVLEKGGEVFFYAPGTLDAHQKVAAVLRY